MNDYISTIRRNILPHHYAVIYIEVMPAKIYIYILCLMVLAPSVGCAPSVRYAAHKSADRQTQVQTQTQPQTQPRNRDGGRVTAPATSSRGATPKRHLERVVNSYLGTPYRFGGTDRRGFDCSGFVLTVYREVYGKTLPRTSSRMFEVTSPTMRNSARPGDIVFFRNNFGPIDHVGIYMGNGKFVHSSSTSGVIYSKLSESYYARRFAGIRRIP